MATEGTMLTDAELEELRKVASGETRPTYTDLARALEKALGHIDAGTAIRKEVEALRIEVNKAREWATSCENEREAAAAQRDKLSARVATLEASHAEKERILRAGTAAMEETAKAAEAREAAVYAKLEDARSWIRTTATEYGAGFPCSLMDDDFQAPAPSLAEAPPEHSTCGYVWPHRAPCKTPQQQYEDSQRERRAEKP